MKKHLAQARHAVWEYLLYSPKAHAAMGTFAVGLYEAVRAAIGHP